LDFAKSLPLMETAKKTKIKKTAAVKFLIVLSFLTILQTFTMQYTLKKRNVKGKKINVEESRGRSGIFIDTAAQSRLAGKTFYGMKNPFCSRIFDTPGRKINASFSDSAVAFHGNRVIFHIVI